jgi:hypothetical protein
MVNRIKYTPVANIVTYFTNVHKMLGTIECTSMVTRIAMNPGCLEMANLAYIEGDVLVLSLDHFVNPHILREGPDPSLSMLYGHKVIRCHTPVLRNRTEASIRVPRTFKSHACQQYDKSMKCFE